jgi:AbrB family looped-hinge helix DNA binding protein
MRTRLSTKGQIVLPGALRSRLGLKPGDPLEATIDGDRIVLTPCRSHASKVKIIMHPISGLPVLTAGDDAPVLTSREVEEILADLP